MLFFFSHALQFSFCKKGTRWLEINALWRLKETLSDIHWGFLVFCFCSVFLGQQWRPAVNGWLRKAWRKVPPMGVQRRRPRGPIKWGRPSVWTTNVQMVVWSTRSKSWELQLLVPFNLKNDPAAAVLPCGRVMFKGTVHPKTGRKTHSALCCCEFLSLRV